MWKESREASRRPPRAARCCWPPSTRRPFMAITATTRPLTASRSNCTNLEPAVARRTVDLPADPRGSAPRYVVAPSVIGSAANGTLTGFLQRRHARPGRGSRRRRPATSRTLHTFSTRAAYDTFTPATCIPSCVWHGVWRIATCTASSQRTARHGGRPLVGRGMRRTEAADRRPRRRRRPERRPNEPSRPGGDVLVA